MPNALSPELIAQMFAQQSEDPFLTLLTLTHATFGGDVRLVNNTEDIVSRGNTYISFPFKMKLPVDDGETQKDFTIELDNVSLLLIEKLRAVTDSIGVKLELILASMPNVVQYSQEELSLKSLSYNKTKISGKIILDDFLNTEMTSEKYTASIYPGLF